MNTKELLNRCLEDLENRLDDHVEEVLLKEWKNFINGGVYGELFRPRRVKAVAPSVIWPDIRVNEAIWDFDKMALQQFGGCSAAIAQGTGNILNIRCNYGSSILISLFGAEMYYMDDKYNTLPTSKPLSGGIEAIKGLIRQGIPDIYGGLGEKVFTMAKYYQELMAPYPKIKKYVHVYHPDLQGPMDVCEVLWGSDLFLDIMDEPEVVHEFLELITQTYTRFMEKWLTIVPFFNGYGVHWGMMYEGNIMIRDDSAMNFSPKMFDEFIKPYDQRLLDVFGGGAIHFCGRGDHYIESTSSMKGLYAMNMSQTDYNNMEKIFKNTVDKGIKLIGFNLGVAQDTLNSGRDLKGNIHC